jgi:preprotein translocase subunit SecE
LLPRFRSEKRPKGKARRVQGNAGAKARSEASSMARVNPGEFLRQVRSESAKIVWPTRRETVMTAIMVVIMTSLLAVFFFGVDTVFSSIVHFLLGLLS